MYIHIHACTLQELKYLMRSLGMNVVVEPAASLRDVERAVSKYVSSKVERAVSKYVSK